MKPMPYLTIVLLLAAAPLRALEADIALEAEFATVIEGGMEVGEDGGASGGSYVWVPDESSTGGFVEFEITIPATGTYAAWGRISSQSNRSDSFWVLWRPTDPKGPGEGPEHPDRYNWDLREGPGWQWQRVTGQEGGPPQPREWKFKAGEVTRLRIIRRESGARLDTIFITTRHTALTPRDAYVRLPVNIDAPN